MAIAALYACSDCEISLGETHPTGPLVRVPLQRACGEGPIYFHHPESLATVDFPRERIALILNDSTV